jgi:hypothetical protein
MENETAHVLVSYLLMLILCCMVWAVKVIDPRDFIYKL